MRVRFAAVLGTCFVVAVVGVAGCGDDEEVSSSQSSTGSSSASSSSSSAGTTQSGEAASSPSPSATSGSNSSEPAGTVQTVVGDGFTARVNVESPAIERGQTDGSTTVLFPVTIDVESGSAKLAPSQWKLRTLSGKTLSGNNYSKRPTALGTGPIDGHIEGVVPFSDGSSSSVLDDGIVITEIDLNDDALFEDNAHLARWTLQPPSTITPAAAPTP